MVANRRVVVNGGFRRLAIRRGDIGSFVTEGLKQLLLVSTSMSGSTIFDERTGLGTSRALQPGRAYDLDGADDYCASDVALPSYPFVMWGRFNVEGSGSRALISLASASKSTAYFCIYVDGSNNLVLTRRSPADGTVNTTIASSVNDGNYHDVVVRFDSDTSFSVWFDGVKTDYTEASVTIDATITKMLFGALRFVSTTFYYDGQIAGGAYWNSALSDSDCAAISDNIFAAGSTAFYKCDEADGTTSYDSSGNSNDGTITNATLSTFHYTGNDVPYSWQNNVGYSDGAGSVLVPRDESDVANDVLGNPLDYTGEAPANASLVNSNCGTLNGTNEYISSGISTSRTSGITVAAWVNPTNFGANRTIWSADTRMNLRFVASTGALRFTTDGVKDYTSSYVATAGSLIHVCAVLDSNFDVSFYVNGAFVDKITGTSAATSGTSPVYFGSRSTAFNFLLGDLCGLFFSESELSAAQVLQLYQGSVPTCVLFYPCAEGGGDTLYDVSGNDNHGTITNATTTPGAGFWANTQDNYHYNILNGFELYDDDATGLQLIRIPYAAGGGKITPSISGFAKVRNNDAGIYHNSAETEIDFTGGVAAPGTAAWETAWTFHDTRTNPLFNRELTASSVVVRADRFLAYEAALSGDNLTTTQTYTATTEI